MADINNIKYTITGFDEQNLVIFVAFTGEGNANIALRGGIPKTKDELDALVKIHAPHKEMVQTIQTASDADMKFIRGSVGKSFTTGRFSNEEQIVSVSEASGVPVPKNNFQFATDFSAQQVDADKDYIIGLIKEVLAEQK